MTRTHEIQVNFMNTSKSQSEMNVRLNTAKTEFLSVYFSYNFNTTLLSSFNNYPPSKSYR